MLKKIFIFLCLTINSTIMVNAEEIDYNARALVGATEQVLRAEANTVKIYDANIGDGINLGGVYKIDIGSNVRLSYETNK